MTLVREGYLKRYVETSERFRAALEKIARYEPGSKFIGEYAVELKQIARDALSEADDD